MTESLQADYLRRYHEILKPIAHNLGVLLKDDLREIVHIDRITARAKSPDSFLNKARAVDDEGKRRYSHPLLQIQDQIGARVITFYREDVEIVAQEVLRYFHHIEERTVVPDSQWKFGYFGRHYILKLPVDAIPTELNPEDAPTFFECQIKTLFQHAWSEANHDVGYKQTRELTDDQQRYLAYTSAQAWGADGVFQDLVNEIKASTVAEGGGG